jgi:hypothetical protein
MAKNKMCHFRKSIYNNKYGVFSFPYLGKPKIKSIKISTQDSLEISKGVYNALSHVGERRQGG